MNWRTHTEVSQAADFMEACEKGWTHGTEFTWLITIKPDGLPVGAVSCFPDGQRAEIGYVLNRQYWGKGYATEAARRVMEWMFDDGAVWRVWASCDVDNLASARVLDKIGMTREGKLRRLVIRPNIGRSRATPLSTHGCASSDAAIGLADVVRDILKDSAPVPRVDSVLVCRPCNTPRADEHLVPRHLSELCQTFRHFAQGCLRLVLRMPVAKISAETIYQKLPSFRGKLRASAFVVIK
jgi:RimJ/RimL family protein N-acetyltransferase